MTKSEILRSVILFIVGFVIFVVPYNIGKRMVKRRVIKYVDMMEANKRLYKCSGMPITRTEVDYLVAIRRVVEDV
jgi:hypothetical protein